MGVCTADAQKAYTYVQQNDTKIDVLGTAAFDVSATSNPTLEFDQDGNATMKIGDNTVAKLPTTDNGQLAVEFTTTVAETSLNKVSKTIDAGFSYATIYSPFQLQMPSTGDIKVYAPTYDETNHVLILNSATEVAQNAIIPACTALLIASNVEFTFSSSSSNYTHTSALSGSALKIAIPNSVEGNTVYTLGQAKEDNSKYGFFRYTGTSLNPGFAYLYVPTVPTTNPATGAKYIAFSFSDTPADISVFETDYNTKVDNTYKIVYGGNVMIVKNGQRYNLCGQKMK